MKKLGIAIFCLLTLVACGKGVNSNAMAEWLKVANSKDDSYTAYANFSSIRKNGNTVKIWNLFDYKSAQMSLGKKYLSAMSQNEFDCKEEQWRILALSFYSGNMREGDMFNDDSDISKWMPIPPDSVVESMWEAACGKK